MEKNKIRVIISDDEPITRIDLRELLEKKGYQVVGESADGFDAIELCRTHHPDLVLMDIKMPILDGLSASKVIYQEQLAGTVVLLTAYDEKEFIESAKESGVGGYLVKPIDEKSLVPSIELAIARSQEMKKLRKDIATVSERLESRKIIEQAKGRLMSRNQLSEQDAYDYIRKLSQKKNVSMKKVAEIILMNKGD